MSGSMVDIKRRIKSIKSTRQITKAMELVASAKLKKARDLATNRKNYTNTLLSLTSNLGVAARGLGSVYFNASKNKEKKLFIVITGERGLAGGFNTNVLKLAACEINNKENSLIISIGLKAREFFDKNNYNVIDRYYFTNDYPLYKESAPIAKEVLKLYKNKEINEVNVIYSKFVNVVSQQPTALKILPISKSDFIGEEDEEKKVKPLLISDPSEDELLQYFVPKYLTDIIYGAMLDSFAGEMAARRMAMSSASDNADDLIEDLEILFNTARQASITQELSEIVAGADASKGS